MLVAQAAVDWFRKLFTKLYAPLVERVYVPQRALAKDLVLVGCQ
jgi:hypothetical protein